MVTPTLPPLLEPISKDGGRGRRGLWGRILQEPARGPRAGIPGCVCVSVPVSVRARVCPRACLLVCASCFGAPQTENDLRAHVKPSLAAGGKSRLGGWAVAVDTQGPGVPHTVHPPGPWWQLRARAAGGPRGPCWPPRLLHARDAAPSLSPPREAALPGVVRRRRAGAGPVPGRQRGRWGPRGQLLATLPPPVPPPGRQPRQLPRVRR